MKKLEAWFESGIDDKALEAICIILINHDAKFYVTNDISGGSMVFNCPPVCGVCGQVHDPSSGCSKEGSYKGTLCSFNLNGDCNYPKAVIDKCTQAFCPLFKGPPKIMYVDKDGLCTCNCADTCVCDPLNTGSALRCTSDKIRAAGFLPVYKGE